AAAFLGTWLAWAVLAVRDPVVVPEPAPVGLRTPQQPVLLLEMAGLFIVGIAALFTRTMRTLNAATPPGWLIGVPTYPVGGLFFLWRLLAAGALPAQFALPAAVGDALTGLAAPVVALAIARHPGRARGWAVAWNLFGILDLLFAPTAAILSGTT